MVSGRVLGALYPEQGLELLQWPAEVSAEANVSMAIIMMSRDSRSQLVYILCGVRV